MAKNPPPLESQDNDQVTLREFCVSLSNEDRRVELISAFHYAETEAGRIKDGPNEYRNRFTAFINKPA